MRISLCVGDYAKTPYCISELQLYVHSIEELCFCLKENAFLLDISFMNMQLVDWIGNECGLTMLAKELTPLVRKKGSLSAFATIIMEYVALYDETTIRNVERVLKECSGVSGIEKKKNQIDYLVENKKYVKAIKEYMKLLADWEAEEDNGLSPSVELKAKIYNNMGYAFTRLFEYIKAADCFKEAYLLTESFSSFNAYIAAMRMGLNDAEYLEFITGEPDSYTPSLELERKLDALAVEYQESEQVKFLNELDAWKNGIDRQKYYDQVEIIANELKESYRNSVTD